MEHASQVIEAWLEVAAEAWITDHGNPAEVKRAMYYALDELKRELDKTISEVKFEAVEEGFAEWNLVTIKEHVRQEHTQKRFKWIA